MKNAGLVLTGIPNPKQHEFFLATARHIAYGGARGGGKSWAMRRKFVLLAREYNGLKLLLLRRTFNELNENHIEPLKAELYGYAEWNESKKVFTFPNGSRIKMGYCDREDDVYQFQGQEYDVVGLEEATRFTESQMLYLATCNRTSRTDFTPRMYYTCNPGGPGHDWVKRLFIDRDFRGEEIPEDYVFIPARLQDNTAVNAGYIQNLKALPEHLRRAQLDGDWDVVEGQFFSEWRRDLHVCKPFIIPSEWRKFRSIDWGYNDPCCVLWYTVGPDGRIYVYDEYYENQTLAHDVALAIRKKTGTDKISYTVASQDMWQKRGAIMTGRGGIEGESIAEIFCKSKVPVRPADNSRAIGWQRVREYLALAPDGLPWLQVFPRCEKLIRYMPQMQYDKHDREDMADVDDHAPESLRYGLMSRPSKAMEAKPKSRVLQYDPLSMPKRVSGGFLSI